jgi:hypothetical protein
MKLFRYLILSFSAVACSISFANDPEDRQMEVIQKFINEKQKINLRKKSVDLTIGGDLRLDWEHLAETVDGVDQRTTQADSDLPLGNNEYDATFNFLVDYKTDKAWATTWLQFNNLLGSKVKDIGGTYNKISLRRAMVGYRLVDEGDLTFNIRAGRTRGYNLFDSKVMYGSNYDGVFFELGYSQPEWFDFDMKGGPFIVSQQDSHYGWTYQVFFNEIAGTGLYLNYAFIDWSKNGTTYDSINSVYLENNPQWDFINSQFILGYRLPEEQFGKAVKVFGSYGFNSAAKGIDLTNGKKANKSWYVGTVVGRIAEEGDWSVEVGYQSVEAQAIRGDDLSGYGIGNAQSNNFYDNNGNALGKCNYKGYGVQGAYALSDNLTMALEYRNTRAKDSSIGGQHKYSKFEAEVVYAF